MRNSTYKMTTRYTDPVEQVSSPSSLTTSWQDIVIVDSRSFREVCLFISLTINDSSGVYLRLVGQTELGGDEYSYPLRIIGNTVTELEYDIYKFKNDADQKMMSEFNLCPAGYSKIQMKVETEGATAATLDSMLLSVTA